MLNEKDIALLDQYILGQLSKDKTEILLKRLEQEPELKSHLMFLLSMDEAFRRKEIIDELKEFENEISQREQETSNSTDSPKNAKKWWTKNFWKLLAIIGVSTVSVIFVISQWYNEEPRRNDNLIQEKKEGLRQPKPLQRIEDSLSIEEKNEGTNIIEDEHNELTFCNCVDKLTELDSKAKALNFKTDSIKIVEILKESKRLINEECKIIKIDVNSTKKEREQIETKYANCISAKKDLPSHQNKDIGTVTFWTDKNIESTYLVYVDDELVGEIKYYFPKGPPECGHPNALNVKLKQGQHEFRALKKINSTKKNDPYWQGIFEVDTNKCMLMKLELN